MSGIGFGTSDVVIVEVLTGLNRLPAEASATRNVQFFLIDAEEALFPEVVGLVAGLRQRGFSAEFSYKRQALGKQFKQASAAGAKYAVIVGRELAETGVLTVKDLSTGEQVQRPRAEFLAKPI